MTQAFETGTGSATLPQTVGQRQAAWAASYLASRRPTAPRPKSFTWFTPALGLLLGGYLFFNKSFAYLHVPGTPVFVGEIVLGIGIVEVLHVRSPWYDLLKRSPILKILLVFMAVCTARLALDLPRYRIDAVRDSSIWYYGIFAFVVAAAAVREPTFVPRLFGWYRRVLPWYFVWAPIAVVLTQVDALSAINVPGTSTAINVFRYNDVAVQVGIGLAFLWLGIDRIVGARPPRARDTLVSVIGVIALMVAGSQSRGGFLAGLGALAIVLAYLPSGRRRRIILSVTSGLLVVLALVLALDLRIEGDRRDVSVQQFADNLSSVTGNQSNEDLSGTVEWREGFWHQVLDDLLSSRAWLTGLGFGQILPERYEVDVGNTNSDTSTQPLRNVHNSHLTVLARVGFPGFGLWLLIWLTWAVHLFRWIRTRSGGVRDPATAVGAWLLAAVPAFLIGAYFDPSLEGPHAAIWLFTLVGVGAASTRVQRRASVGPVGARPAVPSRLDLAPKAPLRVRVGHLAGRLGWGVADQAVSSLTSIVVGLYVARSLGVQEFGAFSLAFATYLIVLAASRRLATDRLAVRQSGEDVASWRRAVASATGTATVTGLATGAACAVIGLLVPGSTGAALLGLGVTLPGLLLQDSWRFAFFAAGKGAQAFVNDLVWALALLSAMVITVATGHASVGWFMLAWGGSAGFAAVVGAVQARLVPRVSETAGWLRRQRNLPSRFFGESLSLSAASQLRLYGLVAIAGLAAAGSLRAAELLLGPVSSIIMVIAITAVSQAGDLRRSSTRRLRPFCLLLGSLGAGGALAWGAALLMLPDALGMQLLQSAWQPASQLLLPVTLALAGFGFSIGAWAGIWVLGAASRSLRAQVIGAVVYLAGALGGAAMGGAAGAAWGSAAGAMIGAGVWWWELHHAMREAEAADG